ncbi:MAG: hypothetical protein ACI4TR_03225 [Bacteroidaceae bacterium]
MKKILLFAALAAASTFAANAQEVARVSRLSIVPSKLTSAGKPVPMGYDEEKQEFTVYDTEFNSVKKFKHSGGTYKYRSYDEVAIISPTGANVAWENVDSWDWNGLQSATTLSEMKNVLTQAHETNNWFGFTDYQGRISCWSPELTSCFDSEWLGATYPYSYYSIVDGYIKRISVNYEPEFSQTAIDNAKWTIYTGDMNYSYYNISPEELYYLDYDNNVSFDEELFCTQTVFNNDDKWEYIVPKYGPVEKNVEDNYIRNNRTNDGYELIRNVHEAPSCLGFDIKNEDGEILATFSDAYYLLSVYKIGGNVYLYTGYVGYGEGVIYKYDPDGITNIAEVARSKAAFANVQVNGRNILVEADDNEVDEVELFDIGGRKLASSQGKNAGNITVDAAGAANGVYSVALKKRGRIVGAQKILLK